MRHFPKVIVLLSVFLCAVSLLAANGDHRISMDFRDADIRDILKIIAEKSGLNLFVEKSVRGNVTVRFTNLPALEALDNVVQSNGFGWEKVGSAIFVADDRKLRQARPHLHVCRLSFVPADDMAKILAQAVRKDLKISTDSLQNAVVLSGATPVIAEARRVCDDLDQPVPQLKGVLNLLVDGKVCKSIEFRSNVSRETKLQDELGWKDQAQASEKDLLGKIGFNFLPERLSQGQTVFGSFQVHLNFQDNRLMMTKDLEGFIQAKFGQKITLADFSGPRAVRLELTLHSESSRH